MNVDRMNVENIIFSGYFLHYFEVPTMLTSNTIPTILLFHKITRPESSAQKQRVQVAYFSTVHTT